MMFRKKARKILIIIVAFVVGFYGYKYSLQKQMDNERLQKVLGHCSAELKAMTQEKDRAVSLMNQAESLLELQVAKQQDCISTIKSARAEVTSCEDSFHRLQTTCNSLKDDHARVSKSLEELKSTG